MSTDPRERPPRSVCILGMHRSGTSMGARMLNLCGLYLGEEDELLPADPRDNPRGYWENRGFMELNQAILAAMGGSWDRPPELAPGWERSPALEELVDRAHGLVERMDRQPPWGWKDPRTCLTFPFWRERIGDPAVVLFVRNPAEVALSLGRGGVNRDLPTARALSLWETYHRAAEEAVEGDAMIVTHYETYFYDPRAELERVTSALGLRPSEAQLQAAVASVSGSLRRLRTPVPSAETRLGRHPAWERYRRLLVRAGPVYARLRHDEEYTRQGLEAGVQALYQELADRVDRCLALEAERDELLARAAPDPEGAP